MNWSVASYDIIGQNFIKKSGQSDRPRYVAFPIEGENGYNSRTFSPIKFSLYKQGAPASVMHFTVTKS